MIRRKFLTLLGALPFLAWARTKVPLKKDLGPDWLIEAKKSQSFILKKWQEVAMPSVFYTRDLQPGQMLTNGKWSFILEERDSHPRGNKWWGHYEEGERILACFDVAMSSDEIKVKQLIHL